MRHVVAAVLVALAPGLAVAQTPTPGTFAASAGRAGRLPPAATAARTAVAPVVDGPLVDEVWKQAPLIDVFTQRDPIEGAPASESTQVRILFDDEAIYVGARLSDRSPVTSRLGRRDMSNVSSDWLRVSFDSYYDRRTAYQFEVNPAGVRRDSTVSGSGIGDLAWDPIWAARTATDADGWTVEMRIPFSQLRFTATDEQIWGLQIERVIDRVQELSQFAFTPKAEAAGVAAYGDLRGIHGVRPGRRLELMPYGLSRSHFADTPDNPFVGDRQLAATGGLDARYRITSNLTLAATANPDFGQVEVDPAVINLTAFETRFDEKRPFFVEGTSSFQFGGSVVGPSAVAASLLYSRRMGRAPQLGVSATERDIPDTAAILGAAKLSGKTASGWSVGVLNALAGDAHGRYFDAGGTAQRALVEPRTNYFVTRVNRELRRGRSAIGGIVTTVNRLGSDPAASGLRSEAYTGGVDFVHEMKDRTYVLTGFLAGSHVGGSERAILSTQRSSTRYFQRPDGRHLTLDPDATSMNGAAASLQLRKVAGLHWTTDSWVQMVTPGYEVNDMGFLQRSDRRAFGQGVIYNQRTPGRIWRDWRSTTYVNHARNFDNDIIDYYYWTSLALAHVSYWSGSANVWYEPERKDDRFTRGGPIARRPATWRYGATLRSDSRKALTSNVDYAAVGNRAGSLRQSLDVSLTVRTSPRWDLSVGPNYTTVIEDAQYVTAVADAAMTSTFGTRYIFAPLRQTQTSLVTRLNYTFTPNLSLELYVQPLVSNGRYGTLKEFLRPGDYAFAIYGEDAGTIVRHGGRYTVDPDGAGPLAAFSVPDRSFTTRSLRGNAVLRWEYRPGSTMFVVWQQHRENPNLMEDFTVTRAFGRLFDGRADQVLAVKWSYWINP